MAGIEPMKTDRQAAQAGHAPAVRDVDAQGWKRLARELAFLAAIGMAGLVACSPFLEYGAPNGHSIAFNLTWLANFSSQLLNGDLYPRWLSGMNHGEGSPVFFFYAPLPFYISSLGVFLFHASKLGVQLAAGEWLLLTLSGMAFYAWARHSIATLPAMLASILYMLMPYHFEIDVWRRQDLGELANYIWMPLVLLFLERMRHSRHAIPGFALAYALMMYSHLPTALLFSLFIGTYGILAWRESGSLQVLYRIAQGAVLGILLASAYLFPALFTQKYISTDMLWNANLDFHRWFMPITHDARSPFTDRLLEVLLLTTLVFALCWGANRFSKSSGTHHAANRPWLFFAAGAWFLMLPLSRAVWEWMPFLWKVQFPWRVSIVLDLATACLLAQTLQAACIRRERLAVWAVAASILLFAFSAYTARQVVGNLDPLEDTRFLQWRDYEVRTGQDAPEYTTVWARAAMHPKGLQAPTVHRIRFDAAKGNIQVKAWRPRSILLAVNLAQSTRLTIRQFYFPGWHAHLVDDGQEISVIPGKAFGLLNMDLPAGKYLLAVEMQWLWQEITGYILSSIGLLYLLMLAWKAGPGRARA